MLHQSAAAKRCGLTQVLAITSEILMNFGVWNIGRKGSASIVADFLKHYDLNHLILVECLLDKHEIFKALFAAGVSGYSFISPLARTSVIIISKSNPGSWIPQYDQDRASIFQLSEFDTPQLLVCAVHLPSKLHKSTLDQARIALDLLEEIKRVETRTQITRTIVAGDFNMNPYDLGMSSILGFNVVSSKRLASSSRRYNKLSYDFFYNPCWNLMGDFKQPPGTYFYGSPGVESTYWNQLDQVIIRPSLADAFIPDSLEIITRIDKSPLSTINGRPSVSDHFPIKFSLDISKVNP